MSDVTICIEGEGTKERCHKHANGSYYFWCEEHGEKHEQSFFEFIGGKSE